MDFIREVIAPFLLASLLTLSILVIGMNIASKDITKRYCKKVKKNTYKKFINEFNEIDFEYKHEIEGLKSEDTRSTIFGGFIILNGTGYTFNIIDFIRVKIFLYLYINNKK